MTQEGCRLGTLGGTLSCLSSRGVPFSGAGGKVFLYGPFAAFLLGVNSTKGQGFPSWIGQWFILWLSLGQTLHPQGHRASSVPPTWCLGLVNVHSIFHSRSLKLYNFPQSSHGADSL